jgi:hypothetical protein
MTSEKSTKNLQKSAQRDRVIEPHKNQNRYSA